MGTEQTREESIRAIESLEQRVGRRFVVGLDHERKAMTSLIIARESRDSIPLRQNHVRLAEQALEEALIERWMGRAGGFCRREGMKIVRLDDQAPTTMGKATNEQFLDALARGVRVIDPPLR